MIPLIVEYTDNPKKIASVLKTKVQIKEYLDTTETISPLERISLLNETMEGFLFAGCKFHAEQTRKYIESLNLKYLMN